ncbi:uncharacterized protein LOC117114597 [Anneissia japonica]|uniref:uncharacterized protein LOC117114597 n=1 Tax=Anneissia japonica TaxID=1529436 RepID=UPI0014258C5F|nr:uncharacterized protein LOC117114597 [Anneissia japonica]
MKEEEFREMLVQLSDAISQNDEKYIDMLRVLYTDLVVVKSKLEEAKSAFELFQLLIAPGILKPTDISVLFETIELTRLRYLKETIEKYEKYPDEVNITQFSAHRQRIVALGRGFSVEDVQKLSKLYGGKVSSNPWKLIQHLEYTSTVLTEDNMPSFTQRLRANNVNEGFNQLLLEISDAISKEDEMYVDMLRILYIDLANIKTKLEETKSAFELFQLLRVAGVLKPTDISVLFETIELTGLRYLKEIIEKYEKYPDEVKITRFSAHRQRIVALGRGFSTQDLQRVCQMYEVPVNISSNQWKVIKFLEERGFASEDNLPNLRKLISVGDKEASTSKRPKLVTVGDKEASTSKRPKFVKGKSGKSRQKKRRRLDEDNKEASTLGRPKLDKDFIIKDCLKNWLKKKYRDVNQMTPAIWREDHKVDIAEVFTELSLLQSPGQVEKEETKEKEKKIKSTSIRKEGRSTSLAEVLDVIKSTDSCKVLITGQGGMGKTTLLKYIAHQWATNGVHNAFAGKLLFLLTIRDIKANEHSLDIIIKQINTKELILKNKLPSNSIETFLTNHANEIVILLDGYDELEKDNEDLINLFKGLQLQESTVVITSRPDNTTTLVACCNVHIEVKGFNSENIKKYICNHFHSIDKPKLGESLIKEFRLDSNFKWYWGGSHKKAFELCSSPLLLLKICTIWQQKSYLPTNLSDLFKELFCCILNQYLNKSGNTTAISQFIRIPNEYRSAILLLGKCIYEGLKENRLTIDKYILTKMADNEKLVYLALKIGFVYEDILVEPGDVRKIYTTPHKLLSEALAGFFLSEQETLEDDEYEVIRCNDNLLMTRVFTLGFLGADACKLLKHWLIVKASNYYSLAQCLEYIKDELKDQVLQQLDNHMPNEMKACCKQMCESFKSVLNCKDITNMHLFKLMQRFMDDYKFTFGKIEKKLMSLVDRCSEESFRNSCRKIVHISVVAQELRKLVITEEKISANSTEHLLKYISDWGDKEINILSAEMENLHFKYSHTNVTLDITFNSSFLIHFLKYANNLSVLSVCGRLKATVLTQVINEFHKTYKKLELNVLDISHNDLSDINGALLRKLFEIAPKLIDLNVCGCELSGDILRKMITECQNNGVKLKSLDISHNYGMDDTLLSDILMENPNLYSLNVSSCKLSRESFTNIVNKIFHYNIPETELRRFNCSRNNLGLLDGKLIGMLLKKLPKLNYFDISYCFLSGSIVCKMIDVCNKMNLVLKDNMLCLEGNDLSDIDSKSFAELIRVSYKTFDFKWSDYCLKTDNLEKIVASIGENTVFNWRYLDLSGVSLAKISGRTLAYLLKISTHLISINMDECCVSGKIVGEMLEECNRINVVFQGSMVSLNSNNLSDIDSKSLARLITDYHIFKWRNYFLTADNLQKLVESISENGTSSWRELDLSKINLSSISARTLAYLFRISTQLTKINMDDCSLSGRIVGEMLKECGRMNVVLKDSMLSLNGNDLSDIECKSIAGLVGIIFAPYEFKWSNYSFRSDNLQKLMESAGENRKFIWKKLNLSGINLTAVSGKTLAYLLKVSPFLTFININDCRLLGKVVREMMNECSRMNVVLQDNMLGLKKIDLSDIDGKSLAEFVRVIAYDDFKWSDYSLTADNLQKLVESIDENRILNWKKLDLSRIDLTSINARTLAYLFKISKHLTNINMNDCSLSGRIIGEMMKECGRMNIVLKDNMLSLKGNDLSDIDSKSIAELVNVVNTPYQFSWSDYSLKTDNLELLVKSVSKNKTLNWRRVGLVGMDLTTISGKTLAYLFKISTDLMQINMDNCSLSGRIVAEMMEECSRMNVVLKDSMLTLEGNNLSDIDGKSLAELVRVIDREHFTFRWSNYSLTANHLERLLESIDENWMLHWRSLDLSRISLARISGKTLAYLFKISTHLVYINFNYCSLSGSIVSEMMEECGKMNVVLKDGMLSVKKNDLSDIDSESLLKLFKVLFEDASKWSDYSLTFNHLHNILENRTGFKFVDWRRGIFASFFTFSTFQIIIDHSGNTMNSVYVVLRDNIIHFNENGNMTYYMFYRLTNVIDDLQGYISDSSESSDLDAELE